MHLQPYALLSATCFGPLRPSWRTACRDSNPDRQTLGLVSILTALFCAEQCGLNRLHSYVVFFCGAATQRGSWPPHSWGFLDHTQRRTTVDRTPLDEWSARRRDLYLDNTQHSNIHAPGGIQTHDLSRQTAADVRLRPRGYWDRPYVVFKHKMAPATGFENEIQTKSFGLRFCQWMVSTEKCCGYALWVVVISTSKSLVTLKVCKSVHHHTVQIN
jgi:hypothetical protein